MLHLASQRLAKVFGLELVLEGGEGLPPPRVPLLRLVGLDGGLEFIVAQIPTEFWGRVRLPGFAMECLNLERE